MYGPNRFRQFAYNQSHPLNWGRLAWWISVPHLTAGTRWQNVVPGSARGNGTINGTAVYDAFSLNGLTSIHAPGVANSNVTLSMPAIANTQPFTFILWFKAVNFNTGNGFMPILDDATRIWTLFINKSGQNAGFTTFFGALSSSFVFSTGTRHQLAVTQTSSLRSWYVDGAFVNSTGSGITSQSAATVHFGDNPSGGGTVGEFYYQSISLSLRQWSATEIQQDYQLNQQGYPGVLWQPRRMAVKAAAATNIWEEDGVSVLTPTWW